MSDKYHHSYFNSNDYIYEITKQMLTKKMDPVAIRKIQEASNKKIISKDDITNLKIDLNILSSEQICQ